MLRPTTLTVLCVLTILCLHSMVYTQSKDNASPDREKGQSQSPAVGTGGPEGGPTGLFTIYDGSTLRRGEFTFSIAYSNYDRDPANVDIVDVPLSFNVGLNDHIEVFFRTTGYRRIAVNTLQKLSSFDLSDSRSFCGAVLCGGSTTVQPTKNQPFTQFQFLDSSSGTFDSSPHNVAHQFVFAAFNILNHLNSGDFGPADNFRGIGSPVGSILPGIVMATTTLPATALNLRITVPLKFTVTRTYVPDAPFVNRLYGEDNPLDVGTVPSYRWWLDKTDDFSGLNQMQRGADPAGDIAEFGLIHFVDGRLGGHVNVSANGGYILNGYPKGVGGDVILLDRPDEVLANVAFDFRLNKDIQPMAEVRSTTYVNGHTPNAFNNNPVEVLGGVKIYPRRWFGVGFAYRRHLNPQDPGSTITVVTPRNINTDGILNRSNYSVNNPFRHLTSGNFIWDRATSQQDRQRIGLFLKQGPEYVKKTCSFWGADSFECKWVREAFDSYGPEGVDNGVIISVGPTQTNGAAAETSVASCGHWRRKTKDNPTGQRTTVTLLKETVNSDDLPILLWHEGSHVADGSKWRASGCQRSPLLYEAEFKAYIVTSLLAQAHKPRARYVLLLPGGGPPRKNPFLPETLPLYLPDLKAEDLRTLRDVNINKLLARPTNAGGHYGVTRESPGPPAFGALH